MSLHRFIWEPKSLTLRLRSCHGPLGLHSGSDVHLRHGNPRVMHTLFHTLVSSFPLAQEMCPGWMVQEGSSALCCFKHQCSLQTFPSFPRLQDTRAVQGSFAALPKQEVSWLQLPRGKPCKAQACLAQVQYHPFYLQFMKQKFQ